MNSNYNDGRLLGTSPIDWCEENYVGGSRIAETFNSWTNISYVIAAASAWRLASISAAVMLLG